MPRKNLAAAALALSLVAAVGAAAAAHAQGNLRFEKTVPYRLDQTIDLGAQVGPVRIPSVVLSRGGGGGMREGIMSRVRPPGGGGDPDVTETIRATFDTQNPSEDEWVVTYTLEFLDAQGRLIDRGSDKEGIEGEAKYVAVEHSTLRYVVPAIARVRIKLEAKYD